MRKSMIRFRPNSLSQVERYTGMLYQSTFSTVPYTDRLLLSDATLRNSWSKNSNPSGPDCLSSSQAHVAPHVFI